MPKRLPEDFDAHWYATTYPDVGISGLSPAEHYLRFGSLLGRPAKGSGEVKPELAKSAPEPAPKPPSPPRTPAPPKVEPPSSPPQPKLKKAAAIIDRPPGFDPLATLPKPAPPRTSEGSGGAFGLDKVANLEGSDPRSSAVTQALQAYARLLQLQAPTEIDDGAAISCAAAAFQSGSARIENAWLPAPTRLRLMLKGHEEGAAASKGWGFRAYQADPAAPGDLHILGEGVQLPPIGPVLHDLELRHPLMPLLLELSDAAGTTQAFALLPFPSLLPGGLHGAELKALQTEPNPIDDVWAFSETLLQEAVGRAGSPARSIDRVFVAGEGGRADQPSLTQEVQDWLSAVFGLVVNSSDASGAEAVQLRLPPDCVPTISALVLRALDANGSSAMVGPYLVAEAGSYRPRWSIALPGIVDPEGAIPALQRGEGKENAAASRPIAPVPLAIALRSPAETPTLPSSAEPSTGPAALSVLLQASDPARAERLIQSLRAAAPDVEWFVRTDDADGEIRLALDRACGTEGWAQPAKDLRQIARNARHQTLVTISDRVEFGDGSALHAVLDLLQREEKAASASCALLAEKVIKKEVVLQPASGGLFPTGVSFASGPRLAFGEPDALQALPGLAYPVVANTLLFTAWRRSALAELPPVAATGQPGVEDIRIGLDLMRAGFSNWCTTKATARLSGPYVPRDQIDPVGAGYMRADSWEEILGRVTVIRELF